MNIQEFTKVAMNQHKKSLGTGGIYKVGHQQWRQSDIPHKDYVKIQATECLVKCVTKTLQKHCTNAAKILLLAAGIAVGNYHKH